MYLQREIAKRVNNVDLLSLTSVKHNVPFPYIGKYDMVEQVWR